jgi:predicted acyl esterase
MLHRAGEDGWDTLDWIARQPWSDGQIATYGCSSSAENQLKLAALNHPAHKAMIAYSAGVGVAEASRFREQGNFWRGGAWQQGWFDYFVAAAQITGRSCRRPCPMPSVNARAWPSASMSTIHSHRKTMRGSACTCR